MKALRRVVFFGLFVGIFALQSACYSQGPLTPPGPPAPTMKTLAQVEPRTPITNLPYFITQPGSYYLATNMTGVSGQDGINITASSVTVDLCGFDLVGVAGSFHGIYVSGSRHSIAIRNGTVRNWILDGVDVSTSLNSQVGQLRISNNAGGGLQVGPNSIVSGCTIGGNTGFFGINALYGCVIGGCAVSSNAGGIAVASGSTVSECTVNGNSGNGIVVPSGEGGVTISGCTVRGNTGDGISVFNGCRVMDNMCDLNGAGATVGAGIHVTGILNRIEGNQTTSGDFGIAVDTTRNLIIRNSAGFNTTNFVIAANNRYGPIIDITASGTAAVSGNSAASTVTTADPWANFAY